MLVYFSSLILAASLSVFLGLFVFFKNMKAKINIIFLCKSLIIAVYIFAAIMVQYSEEVPGVLFWYRIMTACVIVVPCVFIYFYSLFVPRDIQNPKLNAVIYVFAGVLLLGIILQNNPFDTQYDLVKGFWVLTESAKNIFLDIVVAYMFFSSTMYFRLLYRWSKVTTVIKEKYHAKILLIGTASVFLSSMFFDIIINAFFKLPHIAPISFFIYFISVFYALNRFHFLHHDLKDHFDEIFDHITDFIVVLDAEGNVIKANNAILQKLKRTEQEMIGQGLPALIDLDGVSKIFDSLLWGSTKSVSVILSFKCGEGKIIADSYISRMSDKFGDFLGIMIIAKENKNIGHLQQKFGISDRQLDIIRLTVGGDSNVQISEKLHISRRTVETHLFAIYSKLDIGSKVELIKLMNEFEL